MDWSGTGVRKKQGTHTGKSSGENGKKAFVNKREKKMSLNNKFNIPRGIHTFAHKKLS